jgi:signal transduction histidine kinase
VREISGLNENASYYSITIKDNGIGFDQEYAEKIFNIFQRLHGKTAYNGSGIGLAMCKKIVLNHNGKVSAQSSPGQGATFTIILPENHHVNYS